MGDPMNTTGLVLCDDMIFASRITGTARQLGLAVQAVRTAEELEARVSQAPPACVILDLGQAKLDIAGLVARLKAVDLFIVAYGSHVDTPTLRAARDAGCDIVLPRSKFVEELPAALPRWLARQA
jgi:CheY-like chemotaxis protein